MSGLVVHVPTLFDDGQDPSTGNVFFFPSRVGTTEEEEEEGPGGWARGGEKERRKRREAGIPG